MACACGNDSCSCQGPVTLELMDEDGVIHPFYVADKLTIDNQSYAFVVGLEDSDTYALLRIEHAADGGEMYKNITDESEWQAIQQYLAQLA